MGLGIPTNKFELKAYQAKEDLKDLGRKIREKGIPRAREAAVKVSKRSVEIYSKQAGKDLRAKPRFNKGALGIKQQKVSAVDRYKSFFGSGLIKRGEFRA